MRKLKTAALCVLALTVLLTGCEYASSSSSSSSSTASSSEETSSPMRHPTGEIPYASSLYYKYLLKNAQIEATNNYHKITTIKSTSYTETTSVYKQEQYKYYKSTDNETYYFGDNCYSKSSNSEYYSNGTKSYNKSKNESGEHEIWRDGTFMYSLETNVIDSSQKPVTYLFKTTIQIQETPSSSDKTTETLTNLKVIASYEGSYYVETITDEEGKYSAYFDLNDTFLYTEYVSEGDTVQTTEKFSTPCQFPADVESTFTMFRDGTFNDKLKVPTDKYPVYTYENGSFTKVSNPTGTTEAP